MPLLNYTTTVAVEKTAGEIQQLLAKNGARSIMMDYDQHGAPIALAFQVETEIGMRGYRLPVNLDAVHKTLTLQWNQGKVPRRFVTREQAARVGWRILKDWTEAQMALLETRMVTLGEIMLPWQITSDGITVYQALMEREYQMLPAAKEG